MWQMPLMRGKAPQTMADADEVQAVVGTKVTKDANGALWSRQDLVLAVAHQDGGAHVDDLEPEYLALTRANGMGWRFHAAGTEDDGAPMTGNPVLASVRQVGWELEWTLRHQLWRELGLARRERPPLRLPDEQAPDPRVQAGDLSKLPYVSFKTQAAWGVRPARRSC